MCREESCLYARRGKKKEDVISSLFLKADEKKEKPVYFWGWFFVTCLFVGLLIGIQIQKKISWWVGESGVFFFFGVVGFSIFLLNDPGCHGDLASTRHVHDLTTQGSWIGSCSCDACCLAHTAGHCNRLGYLLHIRRTGVRCCLGHRGRGRHRIWSLSHDHHGHGRHGSAPEIFQSRVLMMTGSREVLLHVCFQDHHLLRLKGAKKKGSVLFFDHRSRAIKHDDNAKEKKRGIGYGLPKRFGFHPLTVRPRSTSTRIRRPNILMPSASLYAAMKSYKSDKKKKAYFCKRCSAEMAPSKTV